MFVKMRLRKCGECKNKTLSDSVRCTDCGMVLCAYCQKQTINGIKCSSCSGDKE